MREPQNEVNVYQHWHWIDCSTLRGNDRSHDSARAERLSDESQYQEVDFYYTREGTDHHVGAVLLEAFQLASDKDRQVTLELLGRENA